MLVKEEKIESYLSQAVVTTCLCEFPSPDSRGRRREAVNVLAQSEAEAILNCHVTLPRAPHRKDHAFSQLALASSVFDYGLLQFKLALPSPLLQRHTATVEGLCAAVGPAPPTWIYCSDIYCAFTIRSLSLPCLYHHSVVCQKSSACRIYDMSRARPATSLRTRLQ